MLLPYAGMSLSISSTNFFITSANLFQVLETATHCIDQSSRLEMWRRVLTLPDLADQQWSAQNISVLVNYRTGMAHHDG